MAYRTKYPYKGHRNSGICVVGGSFRPNGSSAISATNNIGAGWSVAYTGTGIYTVTLDEAYRRLLCADLSLALSAVADTALQWGAIDVVTAKTLVINALTAGVAADIASNAANRIYFRLELQDTAAQV
jgi:hypothetical protein